MTDVKHPDTIPDLAPDCRRVLRDAHMKIAVAQQDTLRDEILSTTAAGVLIRSIAGRTMIDYRVARAEARKRGLVAGAIAEYRRIAALWGVDVG